MRFRKSNFSWLLLARIVIIYIAKGTAKELLIEFHVCFSGLASGLFLLVLIDLDLEAVGNVLFAVVTQNVHH